MGRVRSRTPVPKRYLMTTKQQKPLRTNRHSLAKQSDFVQRQKNIMKPTDFMNNQKTL